VAEVRDLKYVIGVGVGSRDLHLLFGTPTYLGNGFRSRLEILYAYRWQGALTKTVQKWVIGVGVT